MRFFFVLIISFCSTVNALEITDFVGHFSGRTKASISTSNSGFILHATLPTGEIIKRDYEKASKVLFKESSKNDPFKDRALSWAVIKQNQLRLFDLFFSKTGSSHIRKLILEKGKNTNLETLTQSFPGIPLKHHSYENLKPFFGTFEGATIETRNSKKRQMKLEINKYDDGFKLQWKTFIETNSPQAPFKKRSACFSFLPGSLPGLYKEDMRVSIFQKARTLNFIKGEPVVWSILYGSTLSTFHLTLDEKHDYSLQIYRRTLSKDNNEINLRYLSYVDGKQMREILGTLNRRT